MLRFATGFRWIPIVLSVVACGRPAPGISAEASERQAMAALKIVANGQRVFAARCGGRFAGSLAALRTSGVVFHVEVPGYSLKMVGIGDAGTCAGQGTFRTFQATATPTEPAMTEGRSFAVDESGRLRQRPGASAPQFPLGSPSAEERGSDR